MNDRKFIRLLYKLAGDAKLDLKQRNVAGEQADQQAVYARIGLEQPHDTPYAILAVLTIAEAPDVIFLAIPKGIPTSVRDGFVARWNAFIADAASVRIQIEQMNSVKLNNWDVYKVDC